MSHLMLPTGAKPSRAFPAARNKGRPSLEVAWLRKRDGDWEILATDSYQMVRVPLKVVADEWEEPLRAEGCISLKAMKAIERAGGFRPERAGLRPIDKNGKPDEMLFDWRDTKALKAVPFDECFERAFTGEPTIRFAFDPVIFADALNALGGASKGAAEVVIRDPIKGLEVHRQYERGVAVIMPIRLTDPYTPPVTATSVLLDAIHKARRRADVVESYKQSLGNNAVGWEDVNKAIIERWSENALKWIKQQAWGPKQAGAKA